jgi:hypothetical protein
VESFLVESGFAVIVESCLVESGLVIEESGLTAAESGDLASVLELLLQAAKAPIASTNKNFFMFKLLMLIEWFPINTSLIKK